MAKTVKIGNEYYKEGVKVPAPKKKAPVAKKKDKIKDAWEAEKTRKARFSGMFGGK